MTKHRPIEVTSHVGRDFLQNAAYFNTLPKLVWEYVANSVDNAKEGVPVVVDVEVTSHEIRVSDNGCGMSREDLRHFFQMHGENIKRKRGKKVRGMFGTGKAAAFGLADVLRIDTTQSGLRNAVELSRQDIENAKDGQKFPVREIVVDESTDQEDGTIVEIRDLHVRRTDVDKVIKYIERHLSRWCPRALVMVNGHECKRKELAFTEEHACVPPDDVSRVIGDVSLSIRVSPTPLDDESAGVDILAHGIWHETTLAGLENRDQANRLFGSVDVPILEDAKHSIPAFDNTRNNTLNRANPVVTTLLGWIAEELEVVRVQLVEQERARRESDLAKQLAEEAKRISDILNQDFADQEIELELRRLVSARSGGQRVEEILDDKGQLWPGGGVVPTPFQQTGSPHGDGHGADRARKGEEPRPGPDVRPGDEPGASKRVAEGKRKRRRAIFTIDYENATEQGPRSRYDRETKTIWINLDHPQIAGAFEAGGRRTEARQFRAMCHEVAAVMYAIALPFERLEKDEMYRAEDALFDVGETIDRVTRRLSAMTQV